MRVFALAVLGAVLWGAALGGMAEAQTGTPAMAVPMRRAPQLQPLRVSPPPQQMTAAVQDPSLVIVGDPVRALQSRMYKLENRIRALESTVGAIRPAVTYQCVSDSLSRNSLGVEEACSPYTCNPIDGRCRMNARNSSDCDPSYAWIEGDICIHK